MKNKKCKKKIKLMHTHWACFKSMFYWLHFVLNILFLVPPPHQTQRSLMSEGKMGCGGGLVQHQQYCGHPARTLRWEEELRQNFRFTSRLWFHDSSTVMNQNTSWLTGWTDWTGSSKSAQLNQNKKDIKFQRTLLKWQGGQLCLFG